MIQAPPEEGRLFLPVIGRQADFKIKKDKILRIRHYYFKMQETEKQ